MEWLIKFLYVQNANTYEASERSNYIVYTSTSFAVSMESVPCSTEAQDDQKGPAALFFHAQLLFQSNTIPIKIKEQLTRPQTIIKLK